MHDKLHVNCQSNLPGIETLDMEGNKEGARDRDVESGRSRSIA